MAYIEGEAIYVNFVECLQSGAPSGDSCPDSVHVYRRKLAELDHQIAELGRRRSELAENLARRCSLRRR